MLCVAFDGTFWNESLVFLFHPLTSMAFCFVSGERLGEFTVSVMLFEERDYELCHKDDDCCSN